MSNKLLDGLNDSQRRAVTSTAPVLLTLAGAGTGKTTVLTRRIAYLHQEHRIGTVNMLALTFTRLAAKEMKERATKPIGNDQGRKLTACTLHAFAVSVIRDWGFKVGIEKNFTIYDQEDRESILKIIIDEFGGRTTLKKVWSVYIDSKGLDIMNPEEGRVLKEYEYRLRSNNAIDLDGLVPMVNKIWKEHPEALQFYQRNYSHVFVDEFQDTSDEQMEMIWTLNPQNLFVVGDDYQAIYGWRQARVEYIIHFPESYPGCEVIKLEDNYRSTHQIVAAANRLIAFNEHQTKKTLIAHKDGLKVKFVTKKTEFGEASKVVSRIRALRRIGLKYNDIVILARTNAIIGYYKTFLDSKKIPALRVSGDDDLFKKHDIRYLIYWMDFYCNRGESIHIKRAITFPKQYLTELQRKEIELFALESDSTFFDAMKHFKEADNVVANLENIGLNATILGANKASEYFKIICDVLGIETIYDSQGLTNRKEDAERTYSYIHRWEESKEYMGEPNDVYAFLKWLRYRDVHEKFIMEDKDAVRLMTIHGAKGLEFDSVFIVGMNQDVFPSKRTEDLEEERRLFYVAVTRAKNYLCISRAKEISSWGGVPLLMDESQFVKEALG